MLEWQWKSPPFIRSKFFAPRSAKVGDSQSRFKHPQMESTWNEAPLATISIFGNVWNWPPHFSGFVFDLCPTYSILPHASIPLPWGDHHNIMRESVENAETFGKAWKTLRRVCAGGMAGGRGDDGKRWKRWYFYLREPLLFTDFGTKINVENVQKKKILR